MNAKVSTALFCTRLIRTYVGCREMERVTVSRVRAARCLTGEHQGHDGRSCSTIAKPFFRVRWFRDLESARMLLPKIIPNATTFERIPIARDHLYIVPTLYFFDFSLSLYFTLDFARLPTNEPKGHNKSSITRTPIAINNYDCIIFLLSYISLYTYVIIARIINSLEN